MRETRTALARTFTLLAMWILPDGIPGPYIHLLKANDRLKEERARQLEEARR